MADYIKNFFAGRQTPLASGEDDFADFAGAPDPSPASISPVTAQAATALGAAPTTSTDVIFTKWYRVWERTSPSDFYAEAVILPFVVVIISLHIWGRRTNQRKAKCWIEAHGPVLEKEYALVGYGGEELLKEKTAQEYATYASGRQNVAFTDVKLDLYKRYNPATLIVEFILSFLFESIRAPAERMVATSYVFDGREKELVPAKSQQQLDAIESQARSKSSVYDQFVFAIVHKDLMKSVREDRYDISLTSTKDHASLPVWATTMSESAAVTDAILTSELVKAIESAGDAFEYLIITDQPLEKPQKLNETAQKKRISISLKVPLSTSPSAHEATLPIFNYYLRLPDVLVQSGKFRPEVRRKIQAVREDEQKKLRKASDEEKAEERRLDGEKKKKEMRDNRLNGMSADEQRKFLEKEREKSSKKQEKKMSRKA